MSQRKKTRVEYPETSVPAATVSPPAATADVEVATPSAGTLNAIFALTAPRCNVLSLRDRKSSLELLDDSVDDAIYMTVKDAWDAIGVPADQYWSHKSSLLSSNASEATTNSWSSYVQQAAKTTQARRLLIPDPRNLMLTFYPARLEAIASRGYATNRGTLIVGLDKPHGNSSKVFNVLSRDCQGDGQSDSQQEGSALQTVSSFITDIKHPFERNLYVLIDEDAPVDPFFDIDFSYAVHDASAGTTEEQLFPSLKEKAPVSQAEVEEALAEVLLLLRDELERELHHKVAQCLVLTSSVQVSRGTVSTRPPQLMELKLSFHVHFRLQNNAVLSNIKHLQYLVNKVRDKMMTDKNNRSRATVLFERLVDCGVYSRWRAFRLPYNVKSPLGPQYTLADAATDDLLSDQLAATGIPLPDIAVGAVAKSVLTPIELSTNVEVSQRQTALLKKLLFHFRFLLPIVPGETLLTTAKLRQFLLEHPVSAPAQQDAAARASALIDMACVQRDDTAGSAVQKVCVALDPNTSSSTRPHGSENSPFDIPIPPRPTSVRVPVYDMNVKKLLAEVFACLSPSYAAETPGPRVFNSFDSMPSAPSGLQGIRPEHLYVQYEEGIRGYYVIQKQNKYCLRQNRCHKSTYAQLYCTYGSIKVRCFSNDCCDRCLTIPWQGGAETTLKLPSAGYPKYERLVAIRNILFPPLSPEELVRRYGAAALRINMTNAAPTEVPKQ